MTAKNTYEVQVRHHGLHENTSTYTYTISAETEERAGQRALDRVKRGRGGTARVEYVRLLRRAHQPREVDA